MAVMPRPCEGPAGAAPEAIGAFLCAVFDEWIRNDLGRIAVQTFDESFRPAAGQPHVLCTFRETCGDVLPECIAFVIKTLTLHRLGAPLCPASAIS